jgi:hypothetical protein
MPFVDDEGFPISLRRSIVVGATLMLGVFVLWIIVGVFFSRASPEAGHEVVLTAHPRLFWWTEEGVLPEPVRAGSTYIAGTTTMVDVDMQPQQFTVHLDDFMSSDRVPLDFDAALRLRVTDSVRLVKNFGPRWYQNNIEKAFVSAVRQEVRNHTMAETALSTAAIDTIDRKVTGAMVTYLVAKKIPVELIDMTVGRANPPESIKAQSVETAAQTQRILTEQQKKLAEDARLAAEESRARSDNAYRNAMMLNPDQFLKLETIKMQRDICMHGSCTVIMNGTASQPIVNLK